MQFMQRLQIISCREKERIIKISFLKIQRKQDGIMENKVRIQLLEKTKQNYKKFRRSIWEIFINYNSFCLCNNLNIFMFTNLLMHRHKRKLKFNVKMLIFILIFSQTRS